MYPQWNHVSEECYLPQSEEMILSPSEEPLAPVWTWDFPEDKAGRILRKFGG